MFKQVAAVPPVVQGMGATDAFIPPKPETVEAMVESPQVGPLRFADRVNEEMPQKVASAETYEEARKPSLFERVTRTGRAAIGFSDNTCQTAEPLSNLTPETPDKTEESEGNEAIMAVSMHAPEAYPNDGVGQNKLVGLGPQPEPKRKEAETEDDMLDIPAFLRRQAN
jgi:cell division protein FtsZ